MRFVTPGFFAALRVPVHAGRDVSEADTATSEAVAVVSESLVKRYWPGQDALGRKFNFAMEDRTIVGVVGDIRVRGLERSSEPQVYLPYKQAPEAPAVRNIIRAEDPNLPVSAVRAMTEVIERQTATRSVQVRVLAGFASVAFLLAAVGIHGVLSFAVSQRTAEIGVRIALGAQRADIFRMVMKQGGRMIAAGLMAGLVLAYFAGRWLEALLAGIRPADVPTFAAAVGLTVVITIIGTMRPTLRAVRPDPITAIRTDSSRR